jgi:hypothetical protein
MFKPIIHSTLKSSAYYTSSLSLLSICKFQPMADPAIMRRPEPPYLIRTTSSQIAHLVVKAESAKYEGRSWPGWKVTENLNPLCSLQLGHHIALYDSPVDFHGNSPWYRGMVDTLERKLDSEILAFNVGHGTRMPDGRLLLLVPYKYTVTPAWWNMVANIAMRAFGCCLKRSHKQLTPEPTDDLKSTYVIPQKLLALTFIYYRPFTTRRLTSTLVLTKFTILVYHSLIIYPCVRL